MQFQAIFDGLKTVAESVPIAIVERLATEFCKNIMTDQGMNGDIICPTVISNYIEHVRRQMSSKKSWFGDIEDIIKIPYHKMTDKMHNKVIT